MEQNDTETEGDEIQVELLFVQTAHTMTAENNDLTLRRLSPSTLYFSDRPDRIAGHMPSSEFVATWGSGDDSFASVPPNAVLSIFQPDEVHDVVVVLTNPRLDGDALTYAVEVLDGELPTSGGECALFIDTIGRPLSPVSVAGAHRRTRRRTARRVSRF